MIQKAIELLLPTLPMKNAENCYELRNLIKPSLTSLAYIISEFWLDTGLRNLFLLLLQEPRANKMYFKRIIFSLSGFNYGIGILIFYWG